MTDSNAAHKRATEIIGEHGCPICGDEPMFYFANGQEGISLEPCGHIISLADAMIMEELKSAIDASHLQAGLD